MIEPPVLDFRLTTFLTLCETRNYTKAADLLCVTQPAVSQQIRQLEEQCGAALVAQSGRRFALTEAGRLLLDYATTARASGRLVLERIRLAADHPPLRFGATRSIGEYLLSKALARFVADHPATPVALTVDNTDALLRRLDSGEIGFACIEGIFDRGGYRSSPFMEDRLVLVCAPGDVWAGQTVLPGDLTQRRLLLREAGSGSRDVLENALARHNLGFGDFPLVTEVGNIGVLKDLARAGVGLAFLYGCSVRAELERGSLAAVRVDGLALGHDFNFVRQRDSPFEREYQAFLDYAVRSSGEPD